MANMKAPKALRSKYATHEKMIDRLRGAGHSYAVTANKMRAAGLEWAKAGGVVSFLREREVRRTTPREPKAVVPVPLDPYLTEIRDMCRQGFTYAQISLLLRGRPGLTDANIEPPRIQYFAKTRGAKPPGPKSAVAYVPRRQRSRLTPHLGTILQARAEGTSLREIGRRHGVTVTAVHSFLAARDRRLAYEAVWGTTGVVQESKVANSHPKG